MNTFFDRVPESRKPFPAQGDTDEVMASGSKKMAGLMSVFSVRPKVRSESSARRFVSINLLGEPPCGGMRKTEELGSEVEI